MENKEKCAICGKTDNPNNMEKLKLPNETTGYVCKHHYGVLPQKEKDK